MLTFLVSAWRSGLRGHSFHSIFVFGVLLVCGAYLAALFSPRQPETVALDVGLSGIRFSLVLLSLIWAQELFVKEIDRRTAILYLAYPMPRAQYVLGRFAGIALLLLAATLVLGLLLWLAVILSSELYDQAHRGDLGMAYWITILGIWLESLVVAAFALCISTLSTVPSLPLILGAAFAIAGQSLGPVLEYLSRGADGLTEMVNHFGATVKFASWVIPDLSRLDWRVWPMYGLKPEADALLLSSLMAAGYITLMLIIATQSFKRREFD